MESLINSLLLINLALTLIIVIYLLNARRKKRGQPEIPIEKIIDAVTSKVVTSMVGSSPSDDRIKPKEGAPVPQSLQEALILYFDHLLASRVILRVLAKQFPNDRVNFPHLAKAVRSEIELKALDDIPERAMRATLQSLVGVNFVNGSDGSFKVTAMGKQLQSELDSRMI